MSSQLTVIASIVFTTLLTGQTPPAEAPKPAPPNASQPRTDQPSAPKPPDDAAKATPAAVDPNTFKIGAEDVLFI